MGITSRRLAPDDFHLLQTSLADDESHQATPIEFFVDPACITNVYEDERGPVMFMRGAKALRLDIQYVNNQDVKRNMKAMLAICPTVVRMAKQHGFSELVFSTEAVLY